MLTDWDASYLTGGMIHLSQHLVGTKGRRGIKKWRTTYQLLTTMFVTLNASERWNMEQVSISILVESSALMRLSCLTKSEEMVSLFSWIEYYFLEPIECCHY
mmetsp:Transcript_8430/g.15275  ORF Transcript_8430/g.15275 Transcript_8430/m.15275 type:complete len:102 (-) Transcript_8430:133-438(-)